MPAVPEDEGKAPAPGGGKWRALLGKEARYLARSLRNGVLLGGVAGGGGVFVACVLTMWSHFQGQHGMMLLFALGYAIYIGVIAAAVLGIAFLSWRAVRAWILVPLVLIPGMLWVALWLSAGFLGAQFVDVLDAMVVASRGHDWVTPNVGHAAHAGPVILVFLAPFILVDLGMIALDPRVLWQLAILAAEVLVVLAAGTIPGAIVSAAALGVAYVRGFRRRHTDGGGSPA